MENNKEMLEATVKGLQEKISQLNIDLKAKQQELDDVNKPVINSSTLSQVEDSVSRVVECFNFECSMFEYEFSIEYDNKLELSELTFTDTYELQDAIMRDINNRFKVINDETNQ
tara:strand:+ start:352 stop:693 length:342 start_codon:yes stop_codon:yes gene_type:complete